MEAAGTEGGHRGQRRCFGDGVSQREAQSAFGHAEVYLERYLTWPRHIEMQVFADSHGNAVWLGDATVPASAGTKSSSRRASAPNFGDDLRQAMGQAAVESAVPVATKAPARSSSYEDGSFYFLEMEEPPAAGGTSSHRSLNGPRSRGVADTGRSLRSFPRAEQGLAGLSRGHSIECV